MSHFTGLLGVGVLLLAALAFSSARSKINWRLVAAGLGLQLALAFLLLRFPPVAHAFELLARGVTKVISFADAGIVFLFGDRLADPSGPWGFVFAVKVLPVIVFFAALMSVLYHLGLMQRLVALVAWMLRKTLGITGAEALSASANIFVGQTEAPLTVKPYIAGMTRSQLFAVMVGGFATIAGSVMAAYIIMLGDAFASVQAAAAGLTGDAARAAAQEGRARFAVHNMTASVMSAPAGIVMAKIMLPETGAPRPESVAALLSDEKPSANVVDAAALGATDGLKLALNVAAMLIAFVALLALINWPLAALGDVPAVAAFLERHDLPVLTLQNLLGLILTPLAFLLGVPWRDAPELGSLLGTQVFATEFVAYLDLARLVREQAIEPRTAAIAAYCLCGFANIASIGIQIGGLSAIAPERRADLAALAPRAMLAGALACWMTGAVAGLVMP
jgi:CNT family concentrative nucleoside transporter